MGAKGMLIYTGTVLSFLWLTVTGMTYKLTPSPDRYNYFDSELFAILGTQTEGNVIVSPLGIKMVLGMLMAGATDRSAYEIKAALRLSNDNDVARGELVHQLRSIEMSVTSNDLKIANGLFVDDRYMIRTQFLKALRDYGSDVSQYPSGVPTALKNTVNGWVARKTNGVIPKLLDGAAADAMIMVANAIYYRGKWESPFRVERTRAECFYTRRGECISVPMMSRTGTYAYGYVEKLDAEVINLPFQDGRYSMTILLPRRVDDVRHLSRDLVHIGLADIMSQLDKREVDVKIPRFTLEYNIDLVPILENMGIVRVFSSGGGLSGISAADNSTLVVRKVVQSVKVIVDEVGSKAAAATGALIVPLMGGRNPEFVANHPFLVLIGDTVTGNILFSGKIENPEGLLLAENLKKMNEIDPRLHNYGGLGGVPHSNLGSSYQVSRQPFLFHSTPPVQQPSGSVSGGTPGSSYQQQLPNLRPAPPLQQTAASFSGGAQENWNLGHRAENVYSSDQRLQQGTTSGGNHGKSKPVKSGRRSFYSDYIRFNRSL